MLKWQFMCLRWKNFRNLFLRILNSKLSILEWVVKLKVRTLIWHGSQDSPTIEISFRGSPEIGPDVDEYAQTILTDKIMNPQGDGYIPFVDSYNTNTEATKNTKWGNSVGNLGK